jgi:hypothetical protein
MPEKIKINVFRKGIFQGEGASIPNGGQTPPIQTTGATL